MPVILLTLRSIRFARREERRSSVERTILSGGTPVRFSSENRRHVHCQSNLHSNPLNRCQRDHYADHWITFLRTTACLALSKLVFVFVLRCSYSKGENIHTIVSIAILIWVCKRVLVLLVAWSTLVRSVCHIKFSALFHKAITDVFHLNQLNARQHTSTKRTMMDVAFRRQQRRRFTFIAIDLEISDRRERELFEK